MQKKLKKLPEGDWLCEECRIKEETENQNAEKLETEEGALGAEGSAKEKQTNETDFDPKNLPKLDTEAVGQEESGGCERLQSPQIPNKKQEDNLEVEVSSKRVLESSGGSMRAVDGKNKSLLSHEVSFSSLGADKLKQAKPLESFGGQTLNNSSFTRSQTFSGPISTKMLDPPQILRGPLAKSGSFNNSNMKPKVQFIDNIPRKQNNNREYNDTRRGQVKKTSESSSVKSIRSSGSNAEPIFKTQPLHLPQQEDFRGIKERHNVEKRSSIQESPLISLVPAASVSNLRPKLDPEVVTVSELKVMDSDRGLLDKNSSGIDEMKSGYSSKNVGQSSSILTAPGVSHAFDRSFNIPDTLLQREKNDKVKDASILGISKQAASGGSGILRCKKCNETGHPTQFCPIDKLSLTALKPSVVDRNVRDPYNKINKSKDGAGEAILKSTIHKDVRLPKHPEKLLIPNVPKDFRNFGTHKMSALVDKKLLHPEATSTSKVCESDHIITISDQLTTPSIPTDLLESSVIPELKFIWQGGFEVLKSGKHSKSCEGVQAHLSTYASPKVLEAAVKFPCKVQLEEVTFLSSWPCHLQDYSPGEHNIALFFFAKDTDSYEKNYSKLLENLIKNDLALKGKIAGAELLIFPSNKLPQNSQRWNRLFFLWGVFKGRGSICSDAQSQPLVHNLPTLASEVKQLNSNEMPSKEITICDSSTELNTVKPTSDIQMSAADLCSQVQNEIHCLKNFHSKGDQVVNPLSLDEKMEENEHLGIRDYVQGKDLGNNDADLGQNRKRSLSTSTEPSTNAADVIPECSETMQLNEKIHFPFADDRREHKKMKLEGHVDCSFQEYKKMNPSSAGFTIHSFDSELIGPGSSRTDERSLFPMDTSCDKIMNLKSSDGEGLLDTPDLELALGGNRKSSGEEILPVPLPNRGDDVAASLSLSLAFNASEKEA